MIHTDMSLTTGPSEKGGSRRVPRLLGRAVRFGLYVAVFLGAAAILFSLLGAWSEPANSVAQFRHILIAGTVLASGLCFLSDRRVAITGLVCCAFGLADMPEILPVAETPSGETARVLQLNLRWTNTDFDALKQMVAEEQPDVIALQEISMHNAGALDVLRDDYPSQIVCQSSLVMSVAILSKDAFLDPPKCKAHSGWVGARVLFGDDEVTLISTHLHWPWPFGQKHQVNLMLDDLASLDGPFVVAGDFNAAAWTQSVRRIAETTGTQPIGGLRFTFRVSELQLPLAIDHILVPGGAADIRKLGTAGSDHNASVADIALPRP
ncbi:MAG: endonuclease/exonuclease/phosphatase family protein [Pseudomonadota bacterium]